MGVSGKYFLPDKTRDGLAAEGDWAWPDEDARYAGCDVELLSKTGAWIRSTEPDPRIGIDCPSSLSQLRLSDPPELVSELMLLDSEFCRSSLSNEDLVENCVVAEIWWSVRQRVLQEATFNVSLTLFIAFLIGCVAYMFSR